MVGRTIDRLFPEREPGFRPHSTALSVRSVSQPGVVKDVSFDLRLGEVLGVSGLMGSAVPNWRVSCSASILIQKAKSALAK